MMPTLRFSLLVLLCALLTCCNDETSTNEPSIATSDANGSGNAINGSLETTSIISQDVNRQVSTVILGTNKFNLVEAKKASLQFDWRDASMMERMRALNEAHQLFKKKQVGVPITVSGIVMNQEGQPISGTSITYEEVSFTGAVRMPHMVNGKVKTDEQGRFLLELDHAYAVRLYILGGDYLSHGSVTISPDYEAYYKKMSESGEYNPQTWGDLVGGKSIPDGINESVKITAVKLDDLIPLHKNSNLVAINIDISNSNSGQVSISVPACEVIPKGDPDTNNGAITFTLTNTHDKLESEKIAGAMRAKNLMLQVAGEKVGIIQYSVTDKDFENQFYGDRGLYHETKTSKRPLNGMRLAPETGYDSSIDLVALDIPTYFYIQANGYYGKGMIYPNIIVSEGGPSTIKTGIFLVFNPSKGNRSVETFPVD